VRDPRLAPLAASFGRVAEAYERGRPPYPPRALRWLAAHVGLTRRSVVLDLAAGTGKLTAGLLPLAGSVIAVEPVAEMRRQFVRSHPGVEVLGGTAEAIPLGPASVDAVLVGAAFHWFRTEPALTEIHRVLRPGGGLGLAWNRPEWEGEKWYPAFTAVMARARAAQGDPPNLVESGGWREALDASALFAPVRARRFRHVHRVDREAFLARVASWSVVAVLPVPERAVVLGEIGAELDRLGVAELALRYRTDTYAAVRT
jgi:SAM-dependent methyltransferase